MEVQLLDLKKQYGRIKPEIDAAIQGVLDAQHFILGPEVSKLEEGTADYVGAKYALGVSSGSDALLMALMALGIKEGDRVITTSFSFFATAGCVSRLGAIPVFVEIEEEGFNISVPALKTLLEDMDEADLKTVKAIIPVHLYGQMADMDALMKVAEEYDLLVVEDAAQAIGSETLVNGKVKRAGSIGAIGCFSFFPTKNLGGYGDGGLVTTNDKDLYEKMKVLRVHGSAPKYYHKVVGGNFRLDAIQAAILNVKLNYLNEWTAERIHVASMYKNHLEGIKQLVIPIETGDQALIHHHIYHQYVIRCQNRDELRAFLNEKGIGTQIYYPIPLHLQECFGYLNYTHGALPLSEKAAEEVLALPMYPELTEEEVKYVVAWIKEFYENR